MSIRRHAADWIKVMGEKLNDSGKEIMFALRDRLGTFSNSPLAGAPRMQGSTGQNRLFPDQSDPLNFGPYQDRTRTWRYVVLCHWMISLEVGYLKTSLSKIG